MRHGEVTHLGKFSQLLDLGLGLSEAPSRSFLLLSIWSEPCICQTCGEHVIRWLLLVVGNILLTLYNYIHHITKFQSWTLQLDGPHLTALSRTQVLFDK